MRTFPGCLLPLLALLVLGLAACDEPVPDGTVDGTCADMTLGEAAAYDADIQPIFDTYCVLCHASSVPAEGHEGRRGAPVLVDYDSYDLAVEFPELTWRRVADRTMPPMGRTPSTEELESLFAFLNCAVALRDGGDDDDSSL